MGVGVAEKSGDGDGIVEHGANGAFVDDDVGTGGEALARLPQLCV
jgi:aconitase B